MTVIISPQNTIFTDPTGNIWMMDANGNMTVTQTIGQGARMAYDSDSNSMYIGYSTGQFQIINMIPAKKGVISNTIPVGISIDKLDGFKLDNTTSLLG